MVDYPFRCVIAPDCVERSAMCEISLGVGRRYRSRSDRLTRKCIAATCRFDQRPQALQIGFGRAAALIDGKVDRPVAEAFQRLAEPADSGVALAPDTVEFNLDGHHLGADARFVN